MVSRAECKCKVNIFFIPPFYIYLKKGINEIENDIFIKISFLSIDNDESNIN